MSDKESGVLKAPVLSMFLGSLVRSHEEGRRFKSATLHQKIRLIRDESGGFLYYFSLNILIKPDGV